jgi:6-phosphogluconolactonase
MAIAPQTGSLSPLNRQPSHGTYPCHLALDRTGNWLFVANYGDGVLAVYPVAEDGSLGPASDVIQHRGRGPDLERQQGPHAHAVYPSLDNRFVLACDLGIDRILVYRFDPEKGKLVLQHEVGAQPGAGPRHLDFHPQGQYLYLINEMSATLTAFRYEDGQLSELQTASILPEGDPGPRSGAEVAVHPSGRFVYASNRGESNSLVIFAVDETTGRLATLSYQSTRGSSPRGFAIDPGGRFLLVANQDSDSVVSFKIDPTTGELGFMSQIKLPSPACVLFPLL